MRLLDAAAQASHLTYEHLNPVAAGLVARTEHMPGTALDWRHWKAGGFWVERPDFDFSSVRPDALWLELTPPPLLMRAFDGDREALIHPMRRLSEDGIRALRDARKRAPMGAQKVRRLHLWAEPKTMAERGGRLVPTFKIGARGFLGRRDACQASNETSAWREEHEACRLERLDGGRPTFPHGTYGMRVLHGVDVAEPKADAIVARPGPLLHEVMAELEQRGAEGERAHRALLLDQVRAAWSSEAPNITDDDELDFASAILPRSPTSRSQRADRRGGSPQPETRHRFHREQDDGRPHARRLIVHRDGRRGRPKKKKGPGRTDPPS